MRTSVYIIVKFYSPSESLKVLSSGTKYWMVKLLKFYTKNFGISIHLLPDTTKYGTSLRMVKSLLYACKSNVKSNIMVLGEKKKLKIENMHKLGFV